MHRGLTGGVCSAYYVHRLALASNRFRRTAAVVNAGALQALNSGHVERAPLYTHGQQQRVAGNLRAVREFEVAVRAIDANAHGFLGREDLHIKAPCLRHRTTRQIAAAQPRRESQIVFNARAEACLAAGQASARALKTIWDSLRG